MLPFLNPTEFAGPPTCQVSLSGSNPEVVDPYGGLGQRQLQRYSNQFGRPMSYGFGIGTSPAANRFNANLEAGKFDGSPLANLIQQGKQVLPQFMAGNQSLGTEVATRAPQLFQQYQQQMMQYMKQLPGYADAGNTALASANQTAAEAQSPIQHQALYQEALRRSLDNSRQGAAGRGLLDSGGQQQLEDQTGKDLAYQFAQSRQQNQMAAQQNQQQMAGGAAQLQSLGPQAQQQLAQAFQQYAELRKQGINIPFEALQQYLGFLGSTQNPTLAAAQAAAPTVANASKTTGIL